MERWRWMPENLGPFYVWDSVPEQMTKVYDEGKLVLAERIVVGKPETPTPMFSADMLFVIFHPSWGVPPGMKANELLPQLQQAGGGFFGLFGGGAGAVLEAHGLRVMRGGQSVNPNSVTWTAATIHQYDFVQPPGPKNVLGMVKFRFPNKHNVYMHDTPERHLFGGGLRTFSHGCMRVQNPVRFAEVLLARDKGMEHGRRGGLRAARRRDQAHDAHPGARHLLHHDRRRRRQGAAVARHLRPRRAPGVGARCRIGRDRRRHGVEFERCGRAGCAAEGPRQAEGPAAAVDRPVLGPVRQLTLALAAAAPMPQANSR